jgi:hypothetical protein
LPRMRNLVAVSELEGVRATDWPHRAGAHVSRQGH